MVGIGTQPVGDNIARYTHRLMEQLTDTGVCVENVTAEISAPVARARIVNAASRLGFKVRTGVAHLEGGDVVIGEHIPVTTLSPGERLRRQGYVTKPVPYGEGVRVAYVIQDKPSYRTLFVGEWENLDDAEKELASFGYPKTDAALAQLKRLRKGDTHGESQEADR